MQEEWELKWMLQWVRKIIDEILEINVKEIYSTHIYYWLS
jgi:hypothetical protein